MATFTERMKGAAFLRAETYEEVESDLNGTGQAGGVVALGALATGIAGAAWGLSGIIGGIIAALLGWLLAAAVTNFIGGTLLGGTATWGELLRTLGFAQAPRILLVLALIPGLAQPVGMVVSLWVLAATLMAIRQALDFSWGKAVVTAILSWLAILIPIIILGALMR